MGTIRSTLATLAAIVVSCVTGCGGADSPDIPLPEPPHSPPPPACSRGKCCPEVDWMLVSPSRTGVGGRIDLDVGVRPFEGRPMTLKWTAEGGKVEASTTAHAKYTCVYPGVFQVRMVATNAFCETSQESHIQCVD